MAGGRRREAAGRRPPPQWSASNSPGSELRVFSTQLGPLEVSVPRGLQEGDCGFTLGPQGCSPTYCGLLRTLVCPGKVHRRKLRSQGRPRSFPGCLVPGGWERSRRHSQSPWPSQRAGACVRGLAVPCGSRTPLGHAVGGGVAQAGDFLHFPLPAPGVQPGLITSHPPRFAPRVPGGSPRLGEGWILINPRPEIPPEGPGRAAGVRGAPGAEPGKPPAPPSSEPAPPTPHHGNWASSRPPRSAPHSCLRGRAGHDGRAAPFRRELRGRSVPPSCSGTSTAPPTPTTPDRAHLLGELGSGAGSRHPTRFPQL